MNAICQTNHCVTYPGKACIPGGSLLGRGAWLFRVALIVQVAHKGLHEGNKSSTGHGTLLVHTCTQTSRRMQQTGGRVLPRWLTPVIIDDRYLHDGDDFTITLAGAHARERTHPWVGTWRSTYIDMQLWWGMCRHRLPVRAHTHTNAHTNAHTQPHAHTLISAKFSSSW